MKKAKEASLSYLMAMLRLVSGVILVSLSLTYAIMSKEVITLKEDGRAEDWYLMPFPFFLPSSSMMSESGIFVAGQSTEPQSPAHSMAGVPLLG